MELADNGSPVARFQRRHIVLVASFCAVVVLPCLVAGIYLFGFAQDRYVSVSGLSVRAEEAAIQPDILSGLTSLNSAAQNDAALVRQFLESPDVLVRLQASLGLESMLSPSGFDPLFWQAPSTLEKLGNRRRRLVSVALDSRTGIITVSVSSFSPQESQQLNQALLDEAAAMIARLSEQSRAEATILARSELSLAEDRLRAAQQRLTELRASNRIVDPSADLEAQLGVLGSLQSQMSEAQIALGLLVQTSNASDPRLEAAKYRVSVIASLIDAERQKFGFSSDGYTQITAEFEARTMDVEYARESYLAARSALDAAIALAQRRSRFLAVHIQPSLPEASEKPARVTSLIMIFAGSVLSWLFGAVGLYGVRGRL